MANKKTLNIIYIVLALLIVTSGLVFYTNYQINLAKQDYQEKISGLSQKTSENMGILKAALEELNVNLSSEIGIIGTSLSNFQKKSQQDLITLSELIDEIERQSSINLEALRDEVKDIQIKSADFTAIVDDVLQSVVSVSTNVGQGSGAIIDSRGYIVTNVHVINGASTIRVATYSNDKYNIDAVAGYDANADIAVLKISAPNLKSLKFGDSDKVKVGGKVIAAGNPAGLSFTVTEGIVSAFRTFNGIDYIQTDVPINPGNSGGPLVNTKGEIIGINNFKAGGFESLGFAISSDEVRPIVNNIISNYESQNQ
jgi:S1-C subfamily serine protease